MVALETADNYKAYVYISMEKTCSHWWFDVAYRPRATHWGIGNHVCLQIQFPIIIFSKFYLVGFPILLFTYTNK